MKSKSFSNVVARLEADPARKARIAQYKQAIDDALALGELRTQRGATQREIAGQLRMTQSNVSRIEHEEDLYLSTLRAYVSALGGELEINAVFPDETIVLIAANAH